MAELTRATVNLTGRGAGADPRPGPSWRELLPAPAEVRLDAASGLTCPMCHRGLIPGIDGWTCAARSCWATWDLWGRHGRWQPLPPVAAATSGAVDSRMACGPRSATGDDIGDVSGAASVGHGAGWLPALVAAALRVLGRGRYTAARGRAGRAETQRRRATGRVGSALDGSAFGGGRFANLQWPGGP